MNPAAIKYCVQARMKRRSGKNPNPAYSTGSLVNVAVVNPIYKAGGRWNTFEIYAKGPQIILKLNGVVTVVAQDGRFPEGRIGLQFNGGPISSADSSSERFSSAPRSCCVLSRCARRNPARPSRIS